MSSTSSRNSDKVLEEEMEYCNLASCEREPMKVVEGVGIPRGVQHCIQQMRERKERENVSFVVIGGRRRRGKGLRGCALIVLSLSTALGYPS